MKEKSPLQAWFRGRKLVLGCLVMAGGLVVAIILVVLLTINWLHTPGELMESHRLIDAHTSFFLAVTLDGQNASTREFLKQLLGPMQRPRIEGDDLPEALSWLIPHLPQKELRDVDIDRLLPITVTVTVPREPPDQASYLVAMSYPRAAHTLQLLDMMLGFIAGADDRLEVVELQGEKALRYHGDDRDLWICIVGTDVLLAPSEAPIGAGLALLSRDPAPEQGALQLALDLSGLPADAPLHMAARAGSAGVLAHFLEPGAPGLAEILRPILQQAPRVRLWGRLDGKDTLSGELASDDWGTTPMEPRTLTWQQKDLRITLEWVPGRGTAAHWRFQVQGLGALLSRWSTDASQSSQPLDLSISRQESGPRP